MLARSAPKASVVLTQEPADDGTTAPGPRIGPMRSGLSTVRRRIGLVALVLLLPNLPVKAEVGHGSRPGGAMRCDLPTPDSDPIQELMQPQACLHRFSGSGSSLPANHGGTRPVEPCDETLVSRKCEEWVATYDNPYSHPEVGFKGNLLRTMTLSPDGSKAYVTGSTWDSRHGHDIYTRWDYATVAYDTETGALLWAQQYNGRDDVGDVAYDVAASPDGNRVFVTGVHNYHTSPGYGTVAYDAATGEELWVASYRGPFGADWGRSVTVSPDGEAVYVTGHSVGHVVSGYGYWDYATAAYDAASGEQLWAARFDEGENLNDWGYFVHVSPNGDRVYVGGASESTIASSESTQTEMLVVAFEAKDPERLGERLWETRFSDPGRDLRSDVPYDMAVSVDGRIVFVAGRAWRGILPEDLNGCACYDFATAAFRAQDGEQLWAKRHRGSQAGQNMAFGIVPSPDGERVFVTGVVSGATGEGTDFHIGTVAYDTWSGAQEWAVDDTGLPYSEEAGGAIAVSPDGRHVFVTGYSAPYSVVAPSPLPQFIAGPVRYEGSQADIVTIAYGAVSGETDWVGRYNSSAASVDTDIPHAVAASPDGKHVYVAGQFQYMLDPEAPPPPGPYTTHFYDYGVIAYEV